MNKNNNKKHACPCCGYFTLNDNVGGNTFQLCLVCYWEDDGIQFGDPSYEGGANRVSLIQAKENFKSFGASEQEFLQYVRLPLEEEK